MLKLLINLEFIYFYQKEYSKKIKQKKYRKMGLLVVLYLILKSTEHTLCSVLNKMQTSNDGSVRNRTTII
jgi:hypothetical protein